MLNGLEFFWEPINALCRMLTARLEWGVTVNAYITPAAARGFTPHSDHQDVMILQLDGAKHWTVYHRPILNPTAKHKVGRTVSRAIIAGVWVAFFQECQQSSCGQELRGEPPALDGYSGSPAWEGLLRPVRH